MACTTQRERHDCEQRGVRATRLEDQVGEWLTTLVIPDDWLADIERPNVDTARIERHLANPRDPFAEADIGREEYIGRERALMGSLSGGLPQPTCSEAVLARAARLLGDLGDLWARAMPAEQAEIAGSLFAAVRVREDRIVAATVARDEYRLLIASPEARAQIGVARPEGLGRARTTAAA